MNAYERRARERKLEAAARRKPDLEFRRAERLIAANKLIQRYEEAYSKYHKRLIKVTYNAGWFTVHSRKVRAIRLEEMARNLESLVHEQSLLHPEDQE